MSQYLLTSIPCLWLSASSLLVPTGDVNLSQKVNVCGKMYVGLRQNKHHSSRHETLNVKGLVGVGRIVTVEYGQVRNVTFDILLLVHCVGYDPV